MCLVELILGEREREREREEGELFGGCLVGRGREENDDGAGCSPQAHKKVFTPRWGENWVGEVWLLRLCLFWLKTISGNHFT